LTLIAAGAGGDGLRATAATASAVPPSRLQIMSRGINADNIVNNTRLAIYDSEDMDKLKSMGFTYVRIPVDPSYILTDIPIEGTTTVSDAAHVAFGLNRLDEHVAKFTHAGFAVMLAVQPMKSITALPVDQSEALILRTTDVLTRRYANTYSPDQLFFETVSEPHYDNATWDAFVPRIVAAIRKNAPNHTIIVPPAWWDLASNFEALTPIADRDIVYTMHVYEPSALTQQGAGGGHHPDYRFPKPADSSDDTEWTEAKLDAYIRVGVDWAAANHVPLIMNEFGTTDVGDRASRLNWVKFVLSEADKYHFGWAWWAFDGRRFGLNRLGKGFDPDLVQLLSK